MEPTVLNHESVLSCLPDRKPDSHKGDYGKILLLCGSMGYTGAAALAAMGALRMGAGLVYLGVTQSIYAIEAVKLTEAVVFPLPDRDGMLDASALDKLLPMLENMDAVLMGPGLGISPGTEAVVTTVLRQYDGPVVLDADGINLMTAHKDILRGRTAPTILTPHAGEFKRLDSNLYPHAKDAAERFAEQYGVIVVYKGKLSECPTVFVGTQNRPLSRGGFTILSGMEYVISDMMPVRPYQGVRCSCC